MYRRTVPILGILDQLIASGNGLGYDLPVQSLPADFKLSDLLAETGTTSEPEKIIMNQAQIDRVLAGINANLPHLHKERWAEEAATLRDVVRNTTGRKKDRAEQALRDHYKTQHLPETSRDYLVQMAMKMTSPTQ